MFRLVLVAAAAAALAAPAGVQAQSYYDQQPGYSQGPPADNDNARGDDYSRDGGDRDGAERDNGGGGYGYGRADTYGNSGDEGYRGEGQGRFTGRVGASWRDDYGRRCQWREVARRDADGYDAYKWVTVCRRY